MYIHWDTTSTKVTNLTESSCQEPIPHVTVSKDILTRCKLSISVICNSWPVGWKTRKSTRAILRPPHKDSSLSCVILQTNLYGLFHKSNSSQSKATSLPFVRKKRTQSHHYQCLPPYGSDKTPSPDPLLFQYCLSFISLQYSSYNDSRILQFQHRLRHIGGKLTAVLLHPIHHLISNLVVIADGET